MTVIKLNPTTPPTADSVREFDYVLATLARKYGMSVICYMRQERGEQGAMMQFGRADDQLLYCNFSDAVLDMKHISQTMTGHAVMRLVESGVAIAESQDCTKH